jgi:hypothetical protein
MTKKLLTLLLFLSLTFWFPAPTYAAIAAAEGAGEIASTANVETYDFPSVSLSGNAVVVIIAFVKVTTSAGGITNVSGDALTWTKKTSATWPAGDGSHSVYVFWAKTPASPVASVYQVNVTGDAGTACGAVMFQFTGADLATSDPIKQVVINDSGTGGSNDANGTFGAALDTGNGYGAAWMGALAGAPVSTQPASWTEIADVSIASPTSNISGAFRAGGETGTTVTFTNASTIWALAAVEVYRAGAGAVRRQVVSGA